MNRLNLDKKQIETMKSRIKRALDYHFSRYRNFEQKIAFKQEEQNEGVEKLFSEKRKKIQFETEAYLNQVGKFSYFLFSMENKGLVDKPSKINLEQIWNSLHSGGDLYTLRGKWSAHRSYDSPRDEDEGVHAQVLTNLDDLRTTMWDGEGHFHIALGEIWLDICEVHDNLIEFIDWVFTEIEKGQ